jgi:ATP-dependent Clp protease protease subunit
MLFIKKRMAELIASHTGQTLETIEADSDRDRWFTAEDAKTYGLIDHVYRNSTDAPPVNSAKSGKGDKQ